VSRLAIEINDAGITVARDGRLLLESPGYALAEADGLLLGPEAEARAYLLPGQTYSRFWDELSTQPLSRPTPQARTPADLAYHHLAAIWEQVQADTSAVILCVPGTYSRAQLELLLGIAQELGIPVQGLVDTALTAARPAPGSKTLLHVDAHLHRIVVTRMTVEGSLRRTDVQVSRDTGFVGLRNAWVKAIAMQFVRTIRFDPLHTADTEQSLHRQLPDLLATLGDAAAVEATVDHAGRRHTVSLPREPLTTAVASLYGRIAALASGQAHGPGAATFITHRLAAFPGLMATLQMSAGQAPVALPAGASALGALIRADELLGASDDFVLTTMLPVEEPAPQAPPVRSPSVTHRPPTHILYHGLAYPLGPEPFLLGRELGGGERGLQLPPDSPGVSRRHCSLLLRGTEVVVEDHSSYGTYVNQERVDGTRVVKVGDRLRLGSGEELQVIAVAEP
jgi:hypothetical protein